ncbi:MAG TPA: MarR family transcriptional regulator [Aldersonia sp.]
MSTTTPEATVVGDLFRTIGRFRRQVRRSAGQSFDDTGLTSSQAEFVRLVGRNPGISVKAAAGEMNLAPNTVSTLVGAMVDTGLLVRDRDPADRRASLLTLTPPAQTIADETRRRRHAMIATALDALTSEETAQLERGLAVLAKLTDLLVAHLLDTREEP